MKRVYITSDIPDVADDFLKENFEVVKNTKGKILSKDELIKIGNEYDGVLTALTNKMDKEVLKESKRAEIFANYAVGYNNFDVEYAKKNNIFITNTPDVLSDTTAETAVSLIFAVSRRIVEADKYVRNGNWKEFSPKLLLGKDIYNKTIGIIGAGRIGHRLAEKLRGFHMRVLYFNRNRDLNFEKSFNANYVGLDELLKESDIISLHVPLTKETENLITKREFDLMKDDAILINTARGKVINQKDMIDALINKKIYGAGLDVFAEEPFIEEELINLNNVVLLPHIGSASKETREKMAIMAAKNITSVLKGGEPINLVY